jgi:hypothetical protein
MAVDEYGKGLSSPVDTAKLIATSSGLQQRKDASAGIKLDGVAIKKKFDRLEAFITRPDVDPLKKVRNLYAFVDWMLSDSGVNKASVCTKGCSHCCYLDVDVTLLEAAYIAHNTGYTMQDREQRLHKNYHEDKQYCGFLDRESGTCSIYEYRPLACRTFFSMDSPDLCDLDNGTAEHAIFTSNSHSILAYLRQQLLMVGGDRYADIREWFKEMRPAGLEVVAEPQKQST